MEGISSVAALSLLGAVLCLTVKKQTPELSVVLAAVCCGAAVLLAIRFLSPILDFLETLQGLVSLPDGILGPVLKTMGIAMLSTLCSTLCQDAGQKALAQAAELAGSVLAVYASLPLLQLLLTLLRELLGG